MSELFWYTKMINIYYNKPFSNGVETFVSMCDIIYKYVAFKSIHWLKM